MSEKYDDIIGLPHHTSPRHPRMSMRDRAAQFAPFSALVGYDDALAESGRLTDRKLVLSEDARAELDRKLAFLADAAGDRPQISVTYFKPDCKKEGGEYLTVVGGLIKTDSYERQLCLEGDIKIPLEDVFEIESELFRGIF